MSFNLQEGSYIYRGDAFGVSARFEHPDRGLVPTQAQAILAPTGGEAYSSVRDFNFQDKVSFSEATARAVGTKHDDTYFTDVTATVRDFRFLQVHADIINMHISSVHRRADKRGTDIIEGDVSLSGSTISGLIIAGHKIEIEWDETLSKYTTFETLRKALPKRGFTYGCGNAKEHIINDSIAKIVGGVQELSAAEAKMLTKDPDARLTGLRYFRNIVLVPDFGKIFIGEVLIERATRRLNMLRVELGCGTNGGGTAGGGTGNGTDIPPASP